MFILLKKSSNLFLTIFSRIFEMAEKMDIGQQLLGNKKSTVLNRGLIIALFHESGTTHLHKDNLKRS